MSLSNNSGGSPALVAKAEEEAREAVHEALLPVVDIVVDANASSDAEKTGSNGEKEGFDNAGLEALSPVARSPRVNEAKVVEEVLDLGLAPENNDKLSWHRRYISPVACIIITSSLFGFIGAMRDGGGWIWYFQYVLFMYLFGMPFFFLELTIGQFTSLQPSTLFGRLADVAQGVGFLILALRVVITLWTFVDIRFLYFGVTAVLQKVVAPSNRGWLSCWMRVDDHDDRCSISCKARGEQTIDGVCREVPEEPHNYWLNLNHSDPIVYERFIHEVASQALSYDPTDEIYYSTFHPYNLRQLLCCFLTAYLCTLLVRGSLKSFSKFAWIFLLISQVGAFVLAIAHLVQDRMLVKKWLVFFGDSTQLKRGFDENAFATAMAWAFRTLSIGDGSIIAFGAMHNFRTNPLLDSFITVTLVVAITSFALISHGLIIVGIGAENEADLLGAIFKYLPTAFPESNAASRLIATAFLFCAAASVFPYLALTAEMIVEIFERIKFFSQVNQKFLRRSLLIIISLPFFGLLRLSQVNMTSEPWERIFAIVVPFVALLEFICAILIYGFTRFRVNFRTMHKSGRLVFALEYVTVIIWAVGPIIVGVLAFRIRRDFSLAVINEFTLILYGFIVIPFCIATRKYVKSVMAARPAFSLVRTHRKWGPAAVGNRRRAEHDERAARVHL